MGYDDRREIFERLERLERMVGSRRREGRGRDDWEERGRGDCDRRHGDRDRGERRRGGDGRDGDEKRIIDTIVHLVVENLDRRLQDRQARTAGRDGGDEKRVVDLIVGLVSEHVREIVASELDRRLGPPSGGDDEPTEEREED